MDKKKFGKLEAIRGFAALYVVLHHTYNNINLKGSVYFAIFSWGTEAVILFFILSGFVINYSFSRSADKSFKNYFFKRFNRIFIPLVISVAANFLVLKIEGKEAVLRLKDVIGNIFMLQDLDRVPNIIVKPVFDNDPLWSLSYEWWFYMIFFVLFLNFKNRHIKAVFITGILATVSYVFFPFWGNRIFMYMIIWNVGAQVASLRLQNKDINFKNMALSLITLTITSVILAFNFYCNRDTIHEEINFTGSFGRNVSPFLEFRNFFFCLIAISAGILWYKLKWRGFNYTIGLFKSIAPISYVFYISHYFLITKAEYLSFIGNKIIEFILYFVICIGFSYLVERIIYPKVNSFIMSFAVKKQGI